MFRHPLSALGVLLLLGTCTQRGVETATPDGGSAADAGGIDARDAGPPALSALGGACRADADCAPLPGGARCLTEEAAHDRDRSAPGGYCTSATCDTSNPTMTCGLASSCADVAGAASPTCALACSQGSDCRAGFACRSGACVAPSLLAPPNGYPSLWGDPVPIDELNGRQDAWLGSMSADRQRICFTSSRDSGSPDVSHIYCAWRAHATDPFGAPQQQVQLLVAGGEWDPFLWRDELYYESTDGGRQGIYLAHWNSAHHAYEAPTILTAFGTGSNDGEPSLSPDGLTIYFRSDRPGGRGGTDIWSATRASLAASFGAPVNVAAVNSSSNEFHPTLAGDGSFLMFTSDRTSPRTRNYAWMAFAATGGGWQAPAPVPAVLGVGVELDDARPLSNGDLLIGGRVGGPYQLMILSASTGPRDPIVAWGTPQPISEVNAGGDAVGGTMTRDGLRLCFSSARAGGQGGDDIWCASRPNRASSFNAPVNQTALNSAGSEYQPALSLDGQELYYVTARSGPDPQIFRSTWNGSTQRYEDPVEYAAINSQGPKNYAPSFLSDGHTLVVASLVNGTNRAFAFNRPWEDAEWARPMPLEEINAGGYVEGVSDSQDGFTLVFNSPRALPGQSAGNGWHAWVAGWLGNGHSTVPAPASVQGVSVPFGARLLNDGSLLIAGALSGGNNGLYLASALSYPGADGGPNDGGNADGGGACGLPGACTPESTRTTSCGYCGQRAETCISGCIWQGHDCNDPCADGMVCSTYELCGHTVTSRIYSGGQCVNAPDFRNGLPTCGEANSLCGTHAVCNVSGSLCYQTGDCNTCCQ